MIRWFFLTAAILTSQPVLAADSVPTPASEGWIQLFDGETLFGWTSSDPGIQWKVVEGAITAGSGKQPAGLLLTDVPFADYELVCEFRMSAGGNSGVFLRTLEQPKEVTADCYEVNIVDEHPAGYLTGSIVGRAKTETPIKGSDEKGTWRTFQITAEKNHFVVKLDGQQVVDHTDTTQGQRATGRVGLQQREGKIEFRRVALRPLGTKPLFNGKDLTGWHPVPGTKAKFTVEDGTIHLSGGLGFLESDTNYSDFVLQVDARTGAVDVNSGVFFRAMPGTEKEPSNGYELQINHAVIDGDRTKPKDQGTGAIFRRAAARKVVGSDKEWCTVTLVTAGPRFATWVNGYPTVDWEDDRKPDPNPRKGKRVDAGHFSLQGHDATTDVYFRRIVVAPTAP